MQCSTVLNGSTSMTGQNTEGFYHINWHLVINDDVTAESSDDSDSNDGDHGNNYQPARASVAM